MSTPEAVAAALLRRASTIAIVGLSANASRDSHRVAVYLQQAGYRVIPVNPMADEVLGETSYPDLASVPVPVDIVEVFRRADQAPAVAREAVAIGAGALWLQLGVVSEEAAAIAAAAGLAVVMDRCARIEHERLTAAA